MPTWNTDEYLKFANERTQPSIDLASRIGLSMPRRVIDLGCGPGNSTAVVAQRWPGSEIIGLDSSSAMLAAARRDHPTWTWIESDIASWAAGGDRSAKDDRFDVVFSNAALQWVPGHGTLLPQIFQRVSEGGALAFQIPHTAEAPHQRCMRELAASSKWNGRFSPPPVAWQVEPVAFYYDALAAPAKRVDLWLTDYAHVMSGPEGVVQWYRGTGLRPYLEGLPDDVAREEFLADYLRAITPELPRRKDGRVLMFFRRLFVIAYR